MSLANVMLSVRAKRERVDELLEKLEKDLDLSQRTMDRLFNTWYLRQDCLQHLSQLQSAIAELHDAEKEALKIKQEEDQMRSVFDDGELCP